MVRAQPLRLRQLEEQALSTLIQQKEAMAEMAPTAAEAAIGRAIQGWAAMERLKMDKSGREVPVAAEAVEAAQEAILEAAAVEDQRVVPEADFNSSRPLHALMVPMAVTLEAAEVEPADPLRRARVEMEDLEHFSGLRTHIKPNY